MKSVFCFLFVANITNGNNIPEYVRSWKLVFRCQNAFVYSNMYVNKLKKKIKTFQEKNESERERESDKFRSVLIFLIPFTKYSHEIFALEKAKGKNNLKWG